MEKSRKVRPNYLYKLNILKNLEIKELQKYVSSPIFNTNSSVLLLLNQLLKFRPNIPVELNRKQLYKKVYPNKKFNDGTMRDLTSQLNKLIHDYLIFKAFKADTNLQERMALKVLTTPKGKDKFDNLIDKINNRITEIETDTHQLFHAYRVEDLAYIYTTRYQNRAIQTNLQEVANRFDNYYLSTKLKYMAVMRNREHIYKQPFKYSLGNEILSYIRMQKVEDFPPTIILYYHLILLLKDIEDKQNFDQLKFYLQKMRESVADWELRQIYTMIINCCRWNILRGGKVSYYAKEAYELYQQMLDNDLIIFEKTMQPSHFRNFVYYSILCNDFDGVEQFIKNNSPFLPQKHRSNVINYSKAALYFSIGETDKAHREIAGVLMDYNNIIDIYYHLYLKTLLLQIYFKQKEWALLEDELKKFDAFLKSKASQFLTWFVEAYQNFAKLIRKMANPNISLKEADFPNLLAERMWLTSLL